MSIKINVGGKIFETLTTTLLKINYFKYLIQDTNYNNEIIFVDRPPHIFKHVLAFVIDNNYKFPIKYKHELDFYDINYDESQLYDKNEKIILYMQNLEKKIEMIGKTKCERHNCNDVVFKDSVCINHHGLCSFFNKYSDIYCNMKVGFDDYYKPLKTCYAHNNK